MAKAKENMYAAAQARRTAEQQEIKAACGVTTAKSTNRKVRLDVTVPASTKDKLVQYAENKGLSVSVVIQMLIDDACV